MSLAGQPLPVPLYLSKVELLGLEGILCPSVPTPSRSVTCPMEAARRHGLETPGAEDKLDLDFGSQPQTQKQRRDRQRSQAGPPWCGQSLSRVYLGNVSQGTL